MTTENNNAAASGETETTTTQAAVEQQTTATEQQEAAETTEAEGQAAETSEAKPEGDKPAAEKPAAKPNKPNPFRARISELTAEKKALEARLAEMERATPVNQQQASSEQAEQTEQQPPEGYIPVSVARQLAAAEAAKIAAKDKFDNDCNAAFAKGTQEYGDFQEAMQNFGALGGLEPEVIEDALATGSAHSVLYDLGTNPDEAARVLRLPRPQRIAEFTRMTMKQPAKPAVSKAPAPVKPIGGTARKDFSFDDDQADPKVWHDKFDEMLRTRKRA